MLRSAATPNRTEVQPRFETTRITTRPFPTATPNAEQVACAPTDAQTIGLTTVAIRLFKG